MEPSPTAQLLRRLATQMGASITIQDNAYACGGFIDFKNGRRQFFRSNELGINQSGAAMLARNKQSAAFVLSTLGYRMPEGKLVRYTIEDHLRQELLASGGDYAVALGFPVIIKPNDMSQGRMVTKVHSRAEYTQAATQIFAVQSNLLIQRFYSGADYRVVVLDGVVMAAYCRVPPAVVGDGQSTLGDLVAQQQQLLERQQRHTTLNLADYRTQQILERQQLSRDSVLPGGERLLLLDNANLSAGGSAFDVTAQVHPTIQGLCREVQHALGLRLCGIDLLLDDISAALADYVILEVNPTPGMKHFATLGAVQAARVEQIYLTILQRLENQEPQ